MWNDTLVPWVITECGFYFDKGQYYRVPIKCLYNFKNVLQRLDLFILGYVKDIVYRSKVRDITNLKQMPLPPLMSVCYGEHGKKSSIVLMCFVQLMVPI
jgi:hypothetical protein